MDLDRFLDPFREPEFTEGFELGAIGLVGAVVLGVIWRWRTNRPAPVAGLVLAAATMLALDGGKIDVDRKVFTALAVLAASGIVVDLLATRWARVSRVLGLLAPVPGGLMLASAGLGQAVWIDRLVGLTAIVGGALLGDLDRRRAEQGVATTMMLVTAGGMYSTVPDTEQVLVFLGAAMAVCITGWPVRLARLGYGGSLAMAGTIATIAAFGGIGRERAVVAGIACLGIALVEPIAHRAARRPDPVGVAPLDTLALLVAHCATVLLCARVAGLRTSLASVSQVAVVVLAGAAVAWTGWAALDDSRARSRHAR